MALSANAHYKLMKPYLDDRGRLVGRVPLTVRAKMGNANDILRRVFGRIQANDAGLGCDLIVRANILVRSQGVSRG